MTIVPDLARPGDIVDKPLTKPNRSGAGTPISLGLTPQYSGEIVLDTGTGALYIAVGVGASDWASYIIAG